MFLSVIIPAYNEEKRLARTIRSVADYLAHQSYLSEILVVNDGSTDGTADLVRTLAQSIPKLKLLDNSVNHGKGFAVKSGMLQAKGDMRLFMDSDGSTSIDQIEKLLPYLSQGYEVAIGSRRVTGALIKTEQPWYRLALGRIFRGIIDFILPLGVIDTQNGFKLFSAASAQAIFSKQTINGWAFDVEVLAIAKRLGYKIKEVPIVWTDDSQSKVTFGGMVKMLGEVVKIRMKSYK